MNYISAKKAAVVLSVAVVLCLYFAAGAQPSDRAVVTFRVAGDNGTLTAASVGGDHIVSGDSVSVDRYVD